MSQEYDNTNRWTLFKNENRQTDKSPQLSGTLNVDGVEFWLNGWVKEGRKGKFFSGSIKRKDNQMAGLRDELNAKSPQAPGRKPVSDDPFGGDSVPF
jgi:hypothetical protein